MDEEIYSSAEDCYELSKELKEKLGKKIYFYGSLYNPTPNGKYLSSYRINNGEYMSYNMKALPFYFKFAKNIFLRIQVGSHGKDNSLGEKLAALSDFYEIINDEFGEATVFYTTKDDDEGLLGLEWEFVNKNEVINKFKNDTYFDDAKIDKLIIIGENNQDLNDTTKRFISKSIGLPIELLPLINENIDEFMKHKNSNELKQTTAYTKKLSK